MSEWKTALLKLPKNVDIDYAIVDELARSLLGKSQYSSSLCSEPVKDAIWTILITAVSKNWTSEELKQNLDQLFSEEAKESLNNCLKTYGTQIRSMLQTVRWDHPNVVDFEWTVSKGLESRDLVRIGVPSTSITFHAISAGEETSKPIHFDCDPFQLQDLHWKVKEALNAYNQLKKQL